ncbi:TetR/AcrR family transcriptional regulator [Mycolicibacterium sp. 018/SC-01/001]|uniref:TetR/AcrR family transcriptional regulator n=1 Tax=Mycolicibacterium sp. 018/SC-01/001 TaxID=2592069 RepID=UPI00117EAD45|nr:TetR/AcrR family transcriptional regulator [Mycolicibacterium sp. 018/SC-01/001]TRW77903.1 TetR/AcrR family transcriptional regulator [Mycolicibacterium sp. 018/SC-01/001]
MTPTTAISTRDRMLEAAIDCIRDKGYAATTARDIVAVSGTNLASIGYHFGSKDALLDEALVQATERWIGPLSLGPTDDMPADLARELDRFIASLHEHRGTAMAFFETLPRIERSPLVRERLAEIYDRLRASVLDRLPPTMRTDALAGAVVALYDGIVVQWLIDPDRPIDANGIVAGLHAATGRSS